MSVFKVRKFRDISLLEHQLQGAVLAGNDPVQGFRNIVGKTLVFTVPSAHTVTFVAGASGPTDLTFLEVKTQIEAVMGDVYVLSLDKQLCIIERTPSAGVVITGGTALNSLGFGSAGATGWVYNYPDGVVAAVDPHYVNTYFDGGYHVLVTRE